MNRYLGKHGFRVVVNGYIRTGCKSNWWHKTLTEFIIRYVDDSNKYLRILHCPMDKIQMYPAQVISETAVNLLVSGTQSITPDEHAQHCIVLGEVQDVKPSLGLYGVIDSNKSMSLGCITIPDNKAMRKQFTDEIKQFMKGNIDDIVKHSEISQMSAWSLSFQKNSETGYCRLLAKDKETEIYSFEKKSFLIAVYKVDVNRNVEWDFSFHNIERKLTLPSRDGKFTSFMVWVLPCYTVPQLTYECSNLFWRRGK